MAAAYILCGSFCTFSAESALAAEFRVPGLNYPAQVRDQLSILPGGRVLRPYGRQVLTGTAPFAIAVSPSGKTIVTANIGISSAIGVMRPSITVIVPGKHGDAWSLSDFPAEPRHPRSQAWQGLTTGLAVVNDGDAWLAEGDSGRVVEVNLSTGTRKGAVNLNVDPYSHSFSDALVLDPSRNLLIVLDQANSRAVLVDLKRELVTASAKTGLLPMALAFSADGSRLYVANAGSANTGSLSILDISDRAAPKPLFEVPLPGASPSGMAVNGDEVYISLADDDLIAVVNGKTAKVEAAIPLRIPGLENFRGITPLGLAFDPLSSRLLIAEAGINAVGMVDPASRKLLGHLPVGWFPDAIGIRNGQVYVASARGFGTGPSEPAHRIQFIGGTRQAPLLFETQPSVLRRGSVSSFALPDATVLAHQTELVMQANGFLPADAQLGRKSVPVHYVVLIAKGNRSFDEVFGDIETAGDKAVLSEPTFARFGSDGYVSGGKDRFSLRVDVTPNQHEMAARWSFADNFYADSDYSQVGRAWLTCARPNLWSETAALYREAGNRTKLKELPAPEPIWSHLSDHRLDFLNCDASLDLDTKSNDLQRARQFISSLRQDYLEAGKPLPRFLFLNLPDDQIPEHRPDDGFPYQASAVAENDYAVGRVVEFLSQTPWWKEMAIFITESGAEGGADHVDSHRIPLLGISPWFRSNYVTHKNGSAPALLKTLFQLLDLAPCNLYDATAGDLSDIFGRVPDFTPYEVKPEDSRLFDPGQEP